MNRTDRLYALVEELRAISPRRRSARELAERHEVSIRTIERDIGALQQAGVPIYADVGRRGGYALDKTMSLPPLNFTPQEAVAMAIALSRAADTPFARASQSAMAKIVAVMPDRDAAAARALADRVRLIAPPEEVVPPFPAEVERAITARRVLRIVYQDRLESWTERDVEPAALLCGSHGWYLLGWCRLRQAARAFRLDRIKEATVTDLPAPVRPFEDCAQDIPALVTRVPAL
ncbi:helix-turn-helix transcriptional regulator [Actinomadura scrupuli]|uniref:helix-turn-helix transcriptional regulator n=1 Tax=Actinomadura scrupuli TaxID=559629 RepID=UPI003D966C59